MPLHIHKEAASVGAERLESTIRGHLGSNKKVLWLVSGGSNIGIACTVAANLSTEAGGFLKAALVDERYGDIGHADSNYQKLIEAGFENNGLLLTPVLQPNLSFEETAKAYEQELQRLMEEADVIVAQLGIGADGHTAGVLPFSPVIDSSKLVDAYNGPDFQRISVTLKGLTRADQAFTFCYGTDKAETLQRLIGTDTSLDEQPSQILKQIPSVYLYNDQIEGDSA